MLQSGDLGLQCKGYQHILAPVDEGDMVAPESVMDPTPVDAQWESCHWIVIFINQRAYSVVSCDNRFLLGPRVSNQVAQIGIRSCQFVTIFNVLEPQKDPATEIET